jgi:hypothetical protein
MKTLILSAIALATVATAAPAMAQAPGAAGCSVSVSFGSYAMGIDRAAFDRVERYTKANRRLIQSVKVTPWGREGERTVCIATRSQAARTTVFMDVRDLIKGKAKTGPTTVSTSDGRSWQANPRIR